MAESATMSELLPGKYSQYVKTLYNTMLQDTPQVSFNEQSAASLKSQLAAAMKPAFEQARRNRIAQTAAGRAQVDADATSRGMGSSTYVTDAKNRLRNAEASDLANIDSNYLSSLYQNLLTQMSDQQAKKLQVDQFNSNARQNALSSAMSTTQSMYDRWQSEEGGAGNGGGGRSSRRRGGYGGGGELTDDGYGGGYFDSEAYKATSAKGKAAQSKIYGVFNKNFKFPNVGR